MIHHSCGRKDKKHMNMSIDAKKAFDKIQHLFMIKTLNKVGIDETYLITLKAIFDRNTTNINFNEEKLTDFPL